jgi:hypothetical protein
MRELRHISKRNGTRTHSKYLHELKDGALHLDVARRRFHFWVQSRINNAEINEMMAHHLLLAWIELAVQNR